MYLLQVEHLPQENRKPGEPEQFRVVRLKDGKRTETVEIRSIAGFPVDGRPNDLQTELRWYLEAFLNYPFPPETEHAERVWLALREWGKQAFDALFQSGKGRDFYQRAVQDGLDKLHLLISSDDPRVLAWPWEGLFDPSINFIAHNCQIERRLNQQYDPPELSPDLPTDRVNILLVTARPYENDVQYRALSRPLVELIRRERLPAKVSILRPPTLEQLRRHLQARPNYFHVVHFDGHGSFGAISAGTSSSYTLRGSQGQLVFETEEGEPDLIPAEKLSTLLREHRIPAVVLNACQSAMTGDEAEGAFASVAAALLQSGVRSVVAMAYSLYVSGGREFLPAFYEQLFRAGEMAQATRAGRQQMYQQQKRECARGKYELEDWLVPVVYQQADKLDFSFAKQARLAPTMLDQSRLPEEARDEENPHKLVGRDAPLLELERALRRKPAGILIQGMGGIGKTTLAAGFVRWLEETEGLGEGCFWFRFDTLHSAEYVFNRLTEGLFGPNAMAASLDEKLEALASHLQGHQYLLVWDNFESVRGIPDAHVSGLLQEEDQQLLKKFLAKLRGGKTKVLITSRSAEDWLEKSNRQKITIGGLQGEERWEYCSALVDDLGLKVDRADPDVVKLLEALNGHPLCMRVILTRLDEQSPQQLLQAFQSNISNFSGHTAEEAKLFSTLKFVEDSLPAELRPLLIPLSLHERFVDANYLEIMARLVPDWSSQSILLFLEHLSIAGLLRPLNEQTYELHPALTSYLRQVTGAIESKVQRDQWTTAFVYVLGSLANFLASKELHQQRTSFQFHGVNFYNALEEASRLRVADHQMALVFYLAAFSRKTRNFCEAKRLVQEQVQTAESEGNERGAAKCYHQLGMIAQDQRDFASAEQWYLKSLKIRERLGTPKEITSGYHQLGTLAEDTEDFASAERWYLKSLEIDERLGEQRRIAASYHQLGVTAQKREDFVSAKRWYLNSLEINKCLGDEQRIAASYHQLGRVAEKLRDFASAKQWYLESLEISKRLGIEDYAMHSYHQLGMVFEENEKFDAAQESYFDSLKIKERLGDEHGAAMTYHQLGRITEKQNDFVQSCLWFLRAIIGYARTNDGPHARMAVRSFGRSYYQASETDKQELKQKWQEAGLPTEVWEGMLERVNFTWSDAMNEAIEKLDDQTAVKVLQAFGSGPLREVKPPELSTSLQQELKKEFAITEPEASVSEGDLARAALLVLANDPDHPEYREAIAALIKSPSPEVMAISPAIMVVSTLCVAALMTRIEIDTEHVKIKKPGLPPNYLVSLVEKLVGFWKQ